MNNSSYKSLEFDRILSYLTELCTSQLGRDQVAQLKPMTDARAIQLALAKVTEFREILDYDQPFPIDGVIDIRSILEKARLEGSILAIEEFYKLSRILVATRNIRQYLALRGEKYPELWQIGEQLLPLPALEQELDRCIDFSQNDIRDTASSKLQSIRKEIRFSEHKLRKIVDNIARQMHMRGYLQENVVSVRNGRFVLMVKEEHKRHVPGLVHDQSASGSSYFIEPIETLELNNQIRELQLGENKEINTILARLTSLVYNSIAGLFSSIQALGDIDFIYAKARMSQQMAGNQPHLNYENLLDLENGCHPLLVLLHKKRETVIPLSVRLGQRVRTLVITGPNAGGKTVALKTIGLMILMTQCGLHIPANSNSRIPIVEKMFVDIGDLQSIENDLSTFSSHLENIRSIYQGANANSLILIDEIGVGTDPEEGAALSMALLEYLTNLEALCVVTTHQGALKVFAYQHPGIENGSMEFDSTALTPTYRFKMGVPGSSYAFEIAQRLGLNQTLLHHARKLLGIKKDRLEQLIIELERKVQEYQKLLQEANLKESELNNLIRLYQERTEAIRRDEKQLKRQAVAESEEIINQANAAVERAIKEIREQNARRDAIRHAKELLQQQKEKVAFIKQEVEVPDEDTSIPIDNTELKTGDQVRWHKFNTIGTILSGPDTTGKILLQSGDMKIRVPIGELIKIHAKKETLTGTIKVIRNEEKATVLNELDLRGKQTDEVVDLVDEYLEEAMLAGFQEVRLIHGKGTGTLRKAIGQILKNHNNVLSFRLGQWNEGDTGVTVVALKTK